MINLIIVSHKEILQNLDVMKELNYLRTLPLTPEQIELMLTYAYDRTVDISNTRRQLTEAQTSTIQDLNFETFKSCFVKFVDNYSTKITGAISNDFYTEIVQTNIANSLEKFSNLWNENVPKMSMDTIKEKLTTFSKIIKFSSCG
jgi:hypothetical protein